MNLACYFFIWGCLCVFPSQSTSCTTPNGESSTCVSLLSCPVLLEAASKDSVTKKFVQESTCSGGTLTVCCGKSGNFTRKLEEPKPYEKRLNESSRDYVMRNKLLPSKSYCGQQHTDDYFYDDTETSVDEFPWMVYVRIPQDYVNNYYLRKESNCVGFLISNRYVLTISDGCLSATREFGINTTVEMRIGQHHIYKDVSCIQTPYEIDDCTATLRVFASGWFTAPSIYSQRIDPIVTFPIGILRLQNKINYSDYIRPICLPIDERDLAKPGDTVFTSGWGQRQSVDGKNVKLKKRVVYTVMDDEECEDGNPVQSPICGLAFENNTHYACPGDSGGPLMYKHNNNWIAVGVVSKTTTCDDIHPVIAERLTSDRMEWIFDAIVFLENRAKVLNNTLAEPNFQDIFDGKFR